MNYATAKSIIEARAPDLILDDEIPGQLHVCVRATERGAPFSIMLPVSTEAVPMTEEEETTAFEHAVDAAKRHFGIA